MKKIFITLLLTAFSLPYCGNAETVLDAPANAAIIGKSESAGLSWKNPTDPRFKETVIFRSTIPIADYFSYQAVDGLCDKAYAGTDESFTDIGLAVNLSYYYILFARDKDGNASKAVILERIAASENGAKKNNTLAGATAEIVNQISTTEAEMVYNYNEVAGTEIDGNSRRLALFIIVKSPHSLTEKDKNAISYFINDGTPTTILLGSGERAGVLNSYLSVFDKLPRNTLEWQDIIKIANGRWPDERNLESEQQAADTYFSAIYERKPDMANPKDSAAVTVIAYGLRPAARNMASEKNAINIYRSIFGKSPAEAVDWDLVRAIAYSGAVR